MKGEIGGGGTISFSMEFTWFSYYQRGVGIKKSWKISLHNIWTFPYMDKWRKFSFSVIFIITCINIIPLHHLQKRKLFFHSLNWKEKGISLFSRFLIFLILLLMCKSFSNFNTFLYSFWYEKQFLLLGWECP